MDASAASARRNKFRVYFNQRDRYRMFVGLPLNQPRHWGEIVQMEAGALMAANRQEYPIDEVRSWIVTYAGTGELVDGDNVFNPLPPGVGTIQTQRIELPAFTDRDLDLGRSMVRIQKGPSPTHREGGRYYSTSLTNISRQPFTCLVFGAYRKSGNGFSLTTVTRQLYSAAQFQAWYGVRPGGWIDPGETVCDPSNYGSSGCWIYHCQARDGTLFHAAEPFAAPGLAGRILKIFGR